MYNHQEVELDSCDLGRCFCKISEGGNTGAVVATLYRQRLARVEGRTNVSICTYKTKLLVCLITETTQKSENSIIVKNNVKHTFIFH